METRKEQCRCRMRRSIERLMVPAVVALLLAVTLPVRAADQRAVKSRVVPVYPEIAKRFNISGVVVVEATVDASGKVTGTKTIHGNHLLSPAAEEAVKKWKFVPGSGVDTVDVDVNFVLSPE